VKPVDRGCAPGPTANGEGSIARQNSEKKSAAVASEGHHEFGMNAERHQNGKAKHIHVFRVRKIKQGHGPSPGDPSVLGEQRLKTLRVQIKRGEERGPARKTIPGRPTKSGRIIWVAPKENTEREQGHPARGFNGLPAKEKVHC